MDHRARHLAAQRVVSIALGIACVASFGALAWVSSVLIGVAAVAVYVFWPLPAPRAQYRYAAGPAVIVPDMLGLVLIALLAGMPVVAGRSDATLLHPSALLLWPMAALFVSLPVITWRRAGFGLDIRAGSIGLETGLGYRDIPFDRIAALRSWRRDLLRHVRALVPFLTALGQPGAAGAILVSRESLGVMLCLRDGSSIVIPGDGLETGLARLKAACAAQGIPFRAGPCPARDPMLKEV